MIFSPHLNTSYSRCGLLLRTERRGLSDTTVNSSKAAEPIVMPFGMWTTPQRERAILWAKRTSAGHARACLAVDILNIYSNQLSRGQNRHGAFTVWRVLDVAHIGAT